MYSDYENYFYFTSDLPECPIGHGGTNCEECEVGFYSDEVGLDPCESCGETKTTAAKGTTQKHDCSKAL